MRNCGGQFFWLERVLKVFVRFFIWIDLVDDSWSVRGCRLNGAHRVGVSSSSSSFHSIRKYIIGWHPS